MARALHLLWGADVGPQDAAGLVAANRGAICAVVAEKIAAGQLLQGNVVIYERDLD